MDDWCKCRFCDSYDDYDGCEWGCNNYEGFKLNRNKIIQKAKEENISVSDVIALIMQE